MTFYTEVDIDLDDILNEISTEDLEEELERRVGSKATYITSEGLYSENVNEILKQAVSNLHNLVLLESALEELKPKLA